MTEIFWVEDFLNGEVIDNKYFSTKVEAMAFRIFLGYGLIKELELQDGGTFEPGTKGKRLIEIA